jgi:hypothetical protein
MAVFAKFGWNFMNRIEAYCFALFAAPTSWDELCFFSLDV